MGEREQVREGKREMAEICRKKGREEMKVYLTHFVGENKSDFLDIAEEGKKRRSKGKKNGRK